MYRPTTRKKINNKINNKKMLINKIERPQTVIKVIVAPIATELKTKVSTAIQSVVDRIKVKHLS
jgi:hypothetical protein